MLQFQIKLRKPSLERESYNHLEDAQKSYLKKCVDRVISKTSKKTSGIMLHSQKCLHVPYVPCTQSLYLLTLQNMNLRIRNATGRKYYYTVWNESQAIIVMDEVGPITLKTF